MGSPPQSRNPASPTSTEAHTVAPWAGPSAAGDADAVTSDDVLKSGVLS